MLVNLQVTGKTLNTNRLKSMTLYFCLFILKRKKEAGGKASSTTLTLEIVTWVHMVNTLENKLNVF